MFDVLCTEFDAVIELTEATEAVVDKHTKKVSVELRCGPFKFHNDKPTFPVIWQVIRNSSFHVR